MKIDFRDYTYKLAKNNKFISFEVDNKSNCNLLFKLHDYIWNKRANTLPIDKERAKFDKCSSDTMNSWYLYYEDYILNDGDYFDYVNVENNKFFIKNEPVDVNKEIIADSELIDLTYTFGNYIIFPKKHINSINRIRGNKKYGDRFDLTLKVIQKYYKKELSENSKDPLENAIKNNSDFFDAFKSFDNYVKFFFLQPYFCDHKENDFSSYNENDDNFKYSEEEIISLFEEEKTKEIESFSSDNKNKEVKENSKIPLNKVAYKEYAENVKKIIGNRNTLIQKFIISLSEKQQSKNEF
ncbi:MAG: hypothetical protein MJ247_07010 [Alphaproteobacteria bacterium]|nr:hypothetical protein [Alphaproteobacteria bacterium]